MTEKKTANRRKTTKPKKKAKGTDDGEALVQVDGTVQMIDNVPHVCELGLCLRLGMSKPSREVAAEYFPLFELMPGEERPEPGEMLHDRAVFCWLTQHEAAKQVGLTTRQVANLETKGLPHIGHRKTKRYALPHLLIWYKFYCHQKKLTAQPFEVAEARNHVFLANLELETVEDKHGL